MRSRTRRLGGIAAASACALATTAVAVAAPAAAATIAPNAACYVNVDPGAGAPMTITGSGFTPGDPIDLAGSGVFATGTADPAGNISIPTTAPLLPTIGPGTMATTITATDENTGVAMATTTVESANLAVQTKPGSVHNVRKDKVTFSFSGFVPGRHIYAYYARRKIVAKATFKKAQGPCGTLKQRALLYPGGRPRNSQYKVTFESTARYSKTVFPRITATLSILRF